MTTMIVTEDSITDASITDDSITDDTAIDLDDHLDHDDESHIVRGLD